MDAMMVAEGRHLGFERCRRRGPHMPGARWRRTGGMLADNIKGLVLTLFSSIFIDASFIVKKKGLKKAGASVIRAGTISRIMLEYSRDAITHCNQNELGPNYFGYYKHLVLELFSQHEDLLFPSLTLDHEASVGTCSRGEDICGHGKDREVNSYSDPMFHLTGGIDAALSELKKEKLEVILRQSAVAFNQEVDEMLDHILALFQIEFNLREKELMSCYSSSSDEDITVPHCSKKRKSSSPSFDTSDNNKGISDPQSLSQVYHDIQALHGGEICQEAVENYSVEICSKLGDVEHDLEDFLNIVVSKRRPMTRAEKQQLGQQIQKLPNKALDRVAELIQARDLSERNQDDDIFVNLELQDNVTLWRLHYYVVTVQEANQI